MCHLFNKESLKIPRLHGMTFRYCDMPTAAKNIAIDMLKRDPNNEDAYYVEICAKYENWKRPFLEKLTEYLLQEEDRNSGELLGSSAAIRPTLYVKKCHHMSKGHSHWSRFANQQEGIKNYVMPDDLVLQCIASAFTFFGLPASAC